MHRLFLSAGLLLVTVCSYAAQEPYEREITKWQEVAIPPESNNATWIIWFSAANYSQYEWRVYLADGQACACLTKEGPPRRGDRPDFTPQIGRLRHVSAFASVDDGWLVGFNEGEFGAALCWFSPDGKQHYKISEHQVVDFFSLPDGVHAIEGLAHLSISEGSVIRIARPKAGEHWQATTMTKLPFAPYAISLRRDGSMLIALSDSLVSIGADRAIQTLLPKAPWSGLYPNSSVLLPNEKKLYIGMRQFVGEFDLSASRLRLLVPSKEFLNKLSKEDEKRIRKQYGD